MKKTISIFLIILLLYGFKIYADSYSFEGITYISHIEDTYLFDNGIFHHYEHFIDENDKDVIVNFTAKYKIMNKNAYTIAEILDESDIYSIYIFSADNKHMILYDCKEHNTIFLTARTSRIDESWIWPINDSTATSCLSEKLKSGSYVTYDIKNLENQNITECWVEGKDGYGINEKISFNINGSRNLYVINGFFSPDNPQLFEYNSRVKTVQINCYDSKGCFLDSFFHEFKDMGNMQLIKFDKRYKKIEFVIKDVYPGLKYTDTAISGLFIDGLDIYN